jgi:DNA-directed RNA polymerase specialized sigma24 family protein
LAVTGSFHTTRWTLVRNARGDSVEARDALGALCELYYEPVVSFLSRTGRDRDTARELAHGFFEKVLAGDFLGEPEPGRGRFRSYLLGALKHHLLNQRRDEGREKRGGGWEQVGLELEHLVTLPDADFDRAWALAIVERALATLEREESHRADQFGALKPWLAAGEIGESQDATAARLGLSVGALKVAIHRLRRRFRDLVRSEVAATLHDPAELDDEMRHLVEALAGRG